MWNLWDKAHSFSLVKLGRAVHTKLYPQRCTRTCGEVDVVVSFSNSNVNISPPSVFTLLILEMKFLKNILQRVVFW